MRSWAAPRVPRLRGEPDGPVWMWDTRTKDFVECGPAHGAVRLYVCGITPYDAAHLGHAATYLAFDLLQRQWLSRRLDVVYVQNVTDVDDPLLERAAATGEAWSDLADRETATFRAEMASLRMLPPKHFVGVVESMGAIVALIGQLGDAVYRIDDDLYFDVSAAPFVFGLDESTMLALSAERGGDPDRPGKRNPLDCVVWRGARPGEPSWHSPWGLGRPGWHVECAAIAHAHLGNNIDVVGGGSDLVFPHHELSAAEVSVATGESSAKAYVHAGMVAYQGAKMAKSDGNLVFVSDLRAAGHDPMAIRLALLAHHYREDWEWHDDEIDAAEDRLARWRAAVARPRTFPALIELLEGDLSDDLNTPEALATVDAWAEMDGDVDQGPLMADAIDALLGVVL